MSKRANGEGSIFPYRNGYAAYVWVTKPDGGRSRKYVYGQTREEVHEAWLKLQRRARQGPVASKFPKLVPFLDYWFKEVVRPNLAPATYVNYEMFVRVHIAPTLGAKSLGRLSIRDVRSWINEVGKTRRASDVRDAAGRSGRAPSGSDADPPARADRGHDGDLRPSFLKGYPGGVETAGRQPWQMTRCCTLLLHGALAGGVVSTANGL